VLALRGFEVDLAWQNGQPRQAQIRSRLGGVCRLRAGVQVRVMSGGEAIPTTQVDPRTIEFPVVAGAEYQLKESL
jgi:alpha-L-fucosidase 2